MSGLFLAPLGLAANFGSTEPEDLVAYFQLQLKLKNYNSIFKNMIFLNKRKTYMKKNNNMEEQTKTSKSVTNKLPKSGQSNDDKYITKNIQK